MEWAYRVLQEPRRLWRRYLVTNTAFVALTATELVHPRPRYARPTPLSASSLRPPVSGPVGSQPVPA